MFCRDAIEKVQTKKEIEKEIMCIQKEKLCAFKKRNSVHSKREILCFEKEKMNTLSSRFIIYLKVSVDKVPHFFRNVKDEIENRALGDSLLRDTSADRNRSGTSPDIRGGDGGSGILLIINSEPVLIGEAMVEVVFC
jgi:hypothetical protein